MHEVFGEVWIPPAVAAELSHPSGLIEVRNWISAPPGWLKIVEVQGSATPDALNALDPGEKQAIQLALECNAENVLIDERLGRKAAASLGLVVIGAIGILLEVHRLGLVARPSLLPPSSPKAGRSVSPTPSTPSKNTRSPQRAMTSK